MANSSFEKIQFEEMTKIQKVDLIESCIKGILEKNTITIDGVEYLELSDFISWMLESL